MYRENGTRKGQAVSEILRLLHSRRLGINNYSHALDDTFARWTREGQRVSSSTHGFGRGLMFCSALGLVWMTMNMFGKEGIGNLEGIKFVGGILGIRVSYRGLWLTLTWGPRC